MKVHSFTINFLILVFLSAFSNAQVIGNTKTPKIAHVNVESIFVDLPETKSARRELQEFEKIRSGELNELQLEFKTLVQRYETESLTASKEMNAALVKEIQDKELRINQFAAKTTEEIKQKEADLLAPILEKLKKTIISIGRKQGYDYVFDGSILLLSDGPDLTITVRRELGLQ